MEALAKDPDRRPTGSRAFADRLQSPARPRTRTIPSPIPAAGDKDLHPGSATDAESAPVPTSGPAGRDGGHSEGRGYRLPPLVRRLPTQRHRLAAAVVLGMLLVGAAG